MAVHFKFRSAAEFDRVEFGEPFISVRDLKRKIAEQKRLNNCQDFDLLITHAQTGEQYNDENALVPKDTTVIIKRVPAEITKAGVSLWNAELVKKDSLDNDPKKDYPQDVLSIPIPATDEFGDLDVNLCGDSDFQAVIDGIANLGEFSGNACLRQEHDQHVSGQCFDHAQMYGVFNQDGQISVNGKADKLENIANTDCNFGDISFKRLSRLRDAENADIITTQEHTNNMELPSELKCFVCHGIFQGAVMIPCCQFSFCYECIKRVLTEKGKCPQCDSPRFKADDLLPNIALRQAIDRFLESQVMISKVEGSAVKNTPDEESAVYANPSAVDKLWHRQGNKRRKPLRVPAKGSATGTAAAKSRKGDRCCYTCGSNGHLAKDCPQRSNFSQTGAIHPGLAMHSGNFAQYGSQTYWHGNSVSNMRPFTNIYGSSPSFPFESPLMPFGPFAISSCMPPIYPWAPLQCGFPRMGGMGPTFVTPSERPLSREEFMELRNQQKQQIITKGQPDRDCIKDNSADSCSRKCYSKFQNQLCEQGQHSYGKHDINCDSVRKCPDESVDQKLEKHEEKRRKCIGNQLCPQEMSSMRRSDENLQKYRQMQECSQEICLGNESDWSSDEIRGRHYSHKCQNEHGTTSKNSISDNIGRSVSELEDVNFGHGRCSSSKHKVSGCTNYEFHESLGRKIEKVNNEFSPEGSRKSKSRKYFSNSFKTVSNHKKLIKYRQVEHIGSYKTQNLSPQEVYGKDLVHQRCIGDQKRKHIQSESEYENNVMYSRRDKRLHRENYWNEKTMDSESNIIDDSEHAPSGQCTWKPQSYEQKVSAFDPILESRQQIYTGLDTESEDTYILNHRRDRYDHSKRKKED